MSVRAWLALAWLVAAACGETPPPTPEAQLEQIVRGMAAAVAERDPAGILDHVGYDFRAEDGVDFPTVRSLVLEYLNREQSYAAEVEALRVGPGDAENERRVHVRVRFLEDGDPSTGSRYEIDVVFRNLAGSWSARRGRYRRVES